MDYDNTNRWALFINENKEQENHADMNGTINIDGKDYWINGWSKESSKTGKKFLSGTVKAKEQTGQPKQASGNFEEDLPF
jgi:hypothetical protein